MSTVPINKARKSDNTKQPSDNTFDFVCSECKFSGQVNDLKVRTVVECPECQTFFYVKSIDNGNRTFERVKFEVGATIESSVEEILEERKDQFDRSVDNLPKR
jgi:hypothetical protein